MAAPCSGTQHGWDILQEALARFTCQIQAVTSWGAEPVGPPATVRLHTEVAVAAQDSPCDIHQAAALQA